MLITFTKDILAMMQERVELVVNVQNLSGGELLFDRFLSYSVTDGFVPVFTDLADHSEVTFTTLDGFFAYKGGRFSPALAF